MSRPSFAAVWSPRLGSAGLALLAIGPLLIHLGATAPMGGFLVFQVGLLLGLVALVTGVLGVLRTGAAGQRTGRPQAVAGLVLGLAVLAVVAFAARDGGGVPAINDITTNTEDPPEFRAVAELDANRGRDMGFPGPLFADLGREEYVAQHTTAYADLTTLELATPVPRTLGDAVAAMKSLGWEIVDVDEERGTVEASDTTAIFRFVDDIVVRVRAAGTGSLVDIRSKSRDGRGDLGANAARIRALRAALAG